MRPALIILTVGALAGIFLITLVNERTEAENERRIAALTPYLIPPVTYRGTDYEITESGTVVEHETGEPTSVMTARAVLRIAQFATEQRIDPLIALPGTDLEQFVDAQNALRQQVERMSQTYEPDVAARIRQLLHPFEFLTALQTAEERRRALIDQPSAIHATAYYHAAQNAIAAYQTYTTAFSDALAEVAPENGRRANYHFTAGPVSIPRFSDVLAFYTREIGRREKELTERWRCYRGVDTACTAPTRPMLADTTRIVASVPDDPFIETTHRIVRTGWQRGAITMQSHPNISSLALADSTCFPSVDQTVYMPLSEDLPGLHADAFRIEFLNDLYFVDLDSDVFRGNAYYVEVRERGIPYIYQPPTNHYMCHELAVDYSAINTSVWLYNTLGHIAADQPESYAVLAPLFEARTTQNWEHLFDEIEQLITTNTERELAKLTSPRTTKDISAAYTSTALQTARFEQLLASAYKNNSIVTAVRAYDTQRISPFDLFFSRSYFKLFLGAGNRSIIAHDLPLATEPGEGALAPLTSYRETLRHTYAPEQVIELFARGARVERELHPQLE